MGDIEEKIKKLIAEEHYYGENSSEITTLLVDCLIEYAKNNPTIGYPELQTKLEEYIDPQYDYCDFSEIIKLVRSATLNEEKLLEEEVIITAEKARELQQEVVRRSDAIEYSGLSRFQIYVMQAIREATIRGTTHISFSYCDVSEENLQWLRKLGYQANYHGMVLPF